MVLVIVSVIGCLATLAQPLCAQVRHGVGEISIKDDKFRARMKELLIDPIDRYALGWQRSQDMGALIAPLLFEMRSVEKADDRRRMVLMCAAVIACGMVVDEQALAAIDPAQQNDPLLACFLIALGPLQEHELPKFWERVRGRRAELNELQAILVLLAAARVPAVASTPVAKEIAKEIMQLSRSIGAGELQSPGIVAAMLAAGLPVPESVQKPYLAFDSPPRFAELVWRGLMLGSLRLPAAVPEALVVSQAKEILKLSSDSYALAKNAAALVLCRAISVPVSKSTPRPPWQLLQLFAAEPQSALLLGTWLNAKPSPLDEQPARLAVEYALSRPLATVIAERSLWGQEPAVQGHVALALAWRLLGEAKVVPIEASLPSLPEWSFVQWASGAKKFDLKPLSGLPAGGVESLNQMLQMLDRVPPAVLREALQDALWRLGSHPGLGLFEAQRFLLRDLVLTGSLAGAKYQQHIPMHERYLPSGGLGSSGTSASFFDVGVEVFDFLMTPRLPLPSECRLR